MISKKIIPTLVALFALFGGAGCSPQLPIENTVGIQSELQLGGQWGKGVSLHVIPHDENGGYDKARTEMTQDKHLSALMEKLKTSKKVRRVILFCHGGLNRRGTSRKSGEEICRQMIAQSKGEIFPISITWRSGFGTTYKDSLFHQRGGLSFKGTESAWTTKLGGIIWKMPSDFISAVSRVPLNGATAGASTIQSWDWAYKLSENSFPVRQSYFRSISKDFHKDAPLKVDKVWLEGFDNLGATLATPPREQVPTRPWFRTSVGKSAPSWDIPLAMQNTAMSPIKLVTLPFVDAGGRPAWENMTKRTRTIVRPDAAGSSKVNQSENSMLADLMRKFQNLKRERPLQIELYGHSMGAMVFNEVIGEILEKRMADPGIDRIVYMAAACSISDFNATVGSYMEKHKKTKVVNLCLHPKCEVRETFHPIGNVAISGSLLVWIDSFYENPRSRLDRTLGSYVNSMISWQYLPKSKNFTMKAFGMQHRQPPALHKTSFRGDLGRDYNAGPQKHGHFTDYHFWTDYYQRIKPANELPQYLKFR